MDGADSIKNYFIVTRRVAKGIQIELYSSTRWDCLVNDANLQLRHNGDTIEY